jgi:hypothetical protein
MEAGPAVGRRPSAYSAIFLSEIGVRGGVFIMKRRRSCMRLCSVRSRRTYAVVYGGLAFSRGVAYGAVSAVFGWQCGQPTADASWSTEGLPELVLLHFAGAAAAAHADIFERAAEADVASWPLKWLRRYKHVRVHNGVADERFFAQLAAARQGPRYRRSP